MPKQITKGFYACRNCGRFPVWAGNLHLGDVCECETYIPQNADEKATAVVKAVIQTLKNNCRPMRWAFDGLEEDDPASFEEMLTELRDVVVKETYRDE